MQSGATASNNKPRGKSELEYLDVFEVNFLVQSLPTS